MFIITFYVHKNHAHNYLLKPFYDGCFRLLCQTISPSHHPVGNYFMQFQIFLVLSISKFHLKPGHFGYFEIQDLIEHSLLDGFFWNSFKEVVRSHLFSSGRREAQDPYLASTPTWGWGSSLMVNEGGTSTLQCTSTGISLAGRERIASLLLTMWSPIIEGLH